jgi:RNA polymerase-interacting CarD/CdnL/TRCF family regulator
MDQHLVKEDSFQVPKKKAESFGVPKIMHWDQLQLNFPVIRGSKVVEDPWVKERHRWSKSLIIATLWDKLIIDSLVTYHIRI